MVNPDEFMDNFSKQFEKLCLNQNVVQSINIVNTMAMMCLAYKKTPKEISELWKACMVEVKNLRAG